MILVTGATGFIGRHVMARLMEAGLPLRVLLPIERQRRLPWDAAHPHAPQLITGNILDEQVAFQAVTGAHSIIHLENAMWWGRLRDLERVEIAGTRNLLTAARSARVGRVIALSQLGAAPSSAYALHRIKGQYEELIRNSGLAYTILRSGLVFGPDDGFIDHIAMMMSLNPLYFPMAGQGEIVLHPTYIGDLVEAIWRSLETLDVVDRTLEIGGLEYATWRELLQTVMRVTRQPRLLLPLPPWMLRALMSVPNRVLPRTLMTPQWLDILATTRTARLGNMVEFFRFQPRRFEDTLLTYMPRRRYFWRALRYYVRRRPRGV